MYLDTYFVIVLEILVLWSLFESLCRCTVSKALDMSTAMAINRCGGCLLLNHVVVVLLMWYSSVIVDMYYLKHC